MMTWFKAQSMLTGRCKEQRKLGNNTWLVRRGNDFAIKLHYTDVVTIHQDGTYTLQTGGWHTVTTKARINEYAPCRVWQKDFEWFVGDKHEFFDGMRVDATGQPVETTVAA